MRDYLALLQENFQKPYGTEPPLPPKAPYGGNGGEALKAFEIFTSAYQQADEEARYCFDERAAVYEYEGGLSRQEAEARAAREVFGAALISDFIN